ncbi:hypothetical protein WS75_26640 [Burkholderia sp. FL-7-2-10-S1-D7]|nr:hypothetical protein WS75_26640 [Burkholderia sp. FL-7-2-10-S1-D7]
MGEGRHSVLTAPSLPSSTLSVPALAGAGLGVALVPAARCRIGGEWGEVQQYLAMLGGRAA